MLKNLATVIMAAGKGTRMKNPDKPKVMYEVLGKPMIDYVTGLAALLHSSRTIVVVGFKRETVMHHIKKVSPEVEFAIQEPQLGTGHAVSQTEPFLRDFRGDVLVLSGDVPLLRPETIEKLSTLHRTKKAVATILTTDLDDPKGYGRIIRGKGHEVVGIIEQKDATESEREITEINSGIYLFKAKELFNALHRITTVNAQHEYYLTDVFALFRKNGLSVAAQKTKDVDEIRGVNTIEQLEEVQKALSNRNRRH
jgi:UDP-N-acetylglucosamine pyrophosphorylase